MLRAAPLRRNNLTFYSMWIFQKTLESFFCLSSSQSFSSSSVYFSFSNFSLAMLTLIATDAGRFKNNYVRYIYTRCIYLSTYQHRPWNVLGFYSWCEFSLQVPHRTLLHFTLNIGRCTCREEKMKINKSCQYQMSLSNIYFEEMKNTLLHNCISRQSHTNCFNVIL